MTVSEYESIWTHLSTVAFRQGWIVADGLKTRFVQAGNPDKPAVIMLHGTGGSWEAFCATLGEHAKHFNCYAIDFMGSGYSDKPRKDHQIRDYVKQIRNFLAEEGIKKTSIIGISMGSWVAARFALDHPDEVEKLTLNAAFGLADDEEEISGIIKRRGKAYDDPSWENIKPIFDALILKEEKRLPDLIAVRQATYSLPDMKELSEHVLSVLGPKYLRSNLITAEEWQKIQAKTLVVVSLNDRPMYLATARRVAELIPNAEVLEMSGVGHWPPFEDPETFNKRNIQFLLSA
jgi:2-hydroxy-6-oxonona-2,4-dienedioate hydrolase